MRIYGSISRLVNLLFRKDSQDITVRPNQATTYTANRDVQLPPGDADQVLTSATSTQTLTNKTISGGSNTLSNISLTASVTGVLPVANGGTNSSTSLSNNRVMKSSGGAIVEAAAITANKALASDANGIPVATATTDTELGYVSGVTSAIQTQLNTKASTAYVDAAINGLSWKNPVLVATTANITLSGEQTIDGVTTSASRVLVKNQTLSKNNGIYVSAAGAWSRSTDMDSLSPLDEFNGAAVFVEQGSTNASKGFVETATVAVIGTDPVTFAQFSSAGAITYTANRALQSDGSGLISASSVTSTELGYLSGVTSALQTQINAKLTGAAFEANWVTGDGTTKAITHSLGSLDVVVQVYDKADGDTIYTDTAVRTDTNTVTLTSSEAPNGSGWRVLITKLG